MANRTSEEELVEQTRAYVRQTQARLKHARGVPEEIRQSLQQKLNELRHAVRDSEFEVVQQLRAEVEGLVETHVAPREKSAWREYAESVGIAVLTALILRAFVVEAFKIPTASMVPTLLVGDHLFVNKFVYGFRVPFTKHYLVRFAEPARGEVVVFSFPREQARRYLAVQPSGGRTCITHASLEAEKDMIKRVVGVSGDTIEVRKNHLMINGEPVERTFLRKESTDDYRYPYEIHERERFADSPAEDGHVVQFQGLGGDFGPVKVKPGHVFVMGDNRDNSSDSRCWGQVPVENIKGRAMILWWSVGEEEGVRWERFGDVIR